MDKKGSETVLKNSFKHYTISQSTNQSISISPWPFFMFTKYARNFVTDHWISNPGGSQTYKSSTRTVQLCT